MKAVVTGSSGFLGRHIASELAHKGWDVTGFDLVPTEIDGVESFVGDLLDPDAVGRVVEGCDVICHVGAIGDVYLARQEPGLASRVNVEGCANIGVAARDAGCRVVYASTWEVYGAPEYEPVDEKHPCRPDHPYNITKLAGERMLFAADELDDVPVVALRLGTAYGTGMRPNSVFEIFAEKARAGEPITIQGDGSQGRQFTHSSDIARAFALAAESDLRRHAFNIVSAEMVSIKQLAEAVIARHATEVTFGDPRPGDVPTSHVSSAKAADLLGWAPSVDFDEGMARFLDHSHD